METPEIIDFFRTPYFLFKADNGFSEKISEEVKSILKDYKVGHINHDPNKSDKCRVPIPEIDFKVQTSVGGFTNNKGVFLSKYKDIRIGDIPSKIKNHIFENISKIQLDLEYGNVWINITSNTDYNRCHNHNSESDLVFVLYLTKGTLWIQNPNNRGKLDMLYNKVGSSVSVDFNVGDMIVFPSDIHHWVEPYPEDYTRISISGNMNIIN
tara:strand:- start:11 stop:640 length:630 start_codon:yes stop_codon:yes gene_type:complete